MAASHSGDEVVVPEVPTPVPTPVVVVAPQFCAPDVVPLTLTNKVMSLTGDDFAITDPNGAVVLQVKGRGRMRHHRCVLLGADGQPMLSFQGKIFSMHNIWEVFRGDSSSPSDLLFSARSPKVLQLLKTEMDIFLAGNTDHQVCDFKVKGNYFDRNCAIYLGDSDIMIAQITREYTAGNVLRGKDAFNVTVFPGVDHVFVAALVLVLDEVHMKHRRHRQRIAGATVVKGGILFFLL